MAGWRVSAAVVGAAVALSLYLFHGDGFDPDEIRNKRVLVTGASGGIGEQIAYHYARLGANVLITARREAELERVAAKMADISPAGTAHAYIAADMAVMTDTLKVIEKVKDTFGGLDHLILNHGMLGLRGHWKNSQVNLTSFELEMRVNTFSFVHLMTHAFPLLESSKGSIGVVSSVAGRVCVSPGQMSYAASKFALEGFFSGLRLQYQATQTPISVSIFTIGLIRTDRGKKLYSHLLVYHPLIAPEPSDAAMAILRGTATRQSDVSYPRYQVFNAIIKLRDFCPGLMHWIFQIVLSV